MAEEKSGLLIGANDKVPAAEAGLLGLQHVLAMDVYVPPLIIAGLLSMSAVETSGFLQVAFLACGIGTLLQTSVFMKMPMSQGPSYIPIGAIVGVFMANGAANGGMAAVIGSSAVAAVLLILLGLSGVYQKIVNTLVPSIVGGTIITCVGLSLLPSALNDNIFQASGNIYQNIELASITMIALLISIAIGTHLPQLQRIFKIGSIVIALAVGTIAASFMGLVNWSTVAKADWFSLPQFTALHYGISFNLSAIITFIIIFMVLTTETTGTWFAMSAVTKEEITNKQWNRGVIGEGLSCLISSLLGSTPMTGYSTNAGIVSITGVASRRVFVAAGIWFVILGFFGKLSALLAAIPSAVVGGVFAVIVVIIMLSGLNVIGDLNMTGNKGYVIGVPIVMTLALVFLPDKVVNDSPQMLQYLLGSPITVAAIIAVVLNLVLSTKKSVNSVSTAD